MPKIHDLDVDAYLFDAVQIIPEAIHEEYVRISADLAYWNSRYASACEAHLRAKIDAERVEARQQLVVRERLLDAGAKATEANVAAAVALDPQVVLAIDARIAAESEKIRLAGACEAVRSKREMLVSLGAHMRAEMGGDPVLRERYARTPTQGG